MENTKTRLARSDQSCAAKLRSIVSQNLIMVLIMVGILVGLCLGLVLRQFNPSDEAITWIGMPGTIYMRLLMMTIMPLVICCVISGASSLDPKTNGKIGMYTTAFVLITNASAILLSTGLVLLIKPGAPSHDTSTQQLNKAMKTSDVFADLIRNLFPDNIISATMRQSVTKYLEVADDDKDTPKTSGQESLPGLKLNMSINSSAADSEVTTAVRHKTVVTFSNSVNILGLITIGVLFGMAAGKVRHKVGPFLSFVDNILQIVLIIVHWFYWFTPIGVVSLIAQAIAQVDNVFETLSHLSMFVVTVMAALLIHGLVVLPVLYAVIVRRNPFIYILAQAPNIAVAFAATTSAVALPQMFEVCEDKFRMDKRITRLTIPFTLTMNADGSAIFIIAASVFLMRSAGIPIDAQNLLAILVLTFMSCLAIPGVPSASILTILIILTAMRAPVELAAILYTTEWFIDRFRTGLNAQSHMTVVACTNALCKKTLAEVDNHIDDECSNDGAENNIKTQDVTLL